jgi:hypothetical protein
MGEVSTRLVETVVGGSWRVGTRDNDTVYLDRYSGPDGTGEQVMNANMDPAEARALGQLLIDRANRIDPKGGLT